MAWACRRATSPFIAATLAFTATLLPADAHAKSASVLHGHGVADTRGRDHNNQTAFTPPLPTAKHLLAAHEWNFSAFVHFGPTTFLPHGADDNCFTNATTNVTAPIASAELFNPTGVSAHALPSTFITEQHTSQAPQPSCCVPPRQP